MHGVIVYAAFRTAVAGVAAALRAQRAICAEQGSGQLQARMVLHTVPAGEQQGDRQPATNRNLLYRQISRLLSTVHPGQILLSAATRELVRDDLPADAGLLDLGNHVLVNSARPEHLYQLVVPDLPSAFPALQTAESLPGRLPIQVTSFIGREHELEKIRHLLGET